MFTLHCKPLYTPTDIDPTPRLSTLARLRRHAHQTCLIIKSIPWGKSDRPVYLTAVIDVASRKVLAHKIAVTMEACHAVEVLEQAFARYGTPEIANTDQGRQLRLKGSSQHGFEFVSVSVLARPRQGCATRGFCEVFG